ncbi:MAG: hypothetical protein KGZ49_07890 [Syntrophaceae bacterium]|nr:hypothetical protein [Syntrophaceae bacterium]
MKEIVGRITDHPNAKTLILEILNETTSFLYATLSALNGWGSPDEVKKDLKQILEGYLSTQNRLGYEHSIMRKPYKEFIADEETVRSAMFYLLNTLFVKCGGNNFPVATIAIYIALERKEGEFKWFFDVLRLDEETFDLKEALYAFWILN